MEFTQEISKRSYKKAIIKHYFAFGFTYINPVFGVTLILIFLFMIFPVEEFEKKSFLYLLGGVFLLLRPLIYVNQIASIHRVGLMKFELNNLDEMTISQNGTSSSFFINELYAYADRGDFLFLYLTKYRFHVIDKRQAAKPFLDQLNTKLNNYGILKK